MIHLKRLSRRRAVRLCLLALSVLAVQLTLHIPSWGAFYAARIYPLIARPLSAASGAVPFAVGDLFIGCSLAWVALWPFVSRFALGRGWGKPLAQAGEYLAWVYVWFYAAWGLNYAQPGFYRRTEVPRASFSEEGLRRFAGSYVERLNASYVPAVAVGRDQLCRLAVEGYRRLSPWLGVHAPFTDRPRVKTMLFTPLISKVGVTGSMGPFFCEFTVNGDVLPAEYPSTYTHELAHLLGITGEAEASFYAYVVCTQSEDAGMRFSGYYGVMAHVLGNVRGLLGEEAYRQTLGAIRPEIRQMARRHALYWRQKYSPLAGSIQDFVYDLYLKGNRIAAGSKDYSQVVGLILSYEEWLPSAGQRRTEGHN